MTQIHSLIRVDNNLELLFQLDLLFDKSGSLDNIILPVIVNSLMSNLLPFEAPVLVNSTTKEVLSLWLLEEIKQEISLPKELLLDHNHHLPSQLGA